MNRKVVLLSILFALVFTFVGLSHPLAVHAACATVDSGSFDSGTGDIRQGAEFRVAAGDIITFTATASNPQNGTTFLAGIVRLTPTISLLVQQHGGPTIHVSAVAPANELYQFREIAEGQMGQITYTVTVGDCGGSDVTQLAFTDGRVNSHDGQETAAVYCNENGGVDVWTVADSLGHFAFTATKAELAKVPEKPLRNTLIKAGGGAWFYRLTTGELQINSANNYVFIWDGCSAS